MIELAQRAWNKRIIRFFLVGGINTVFGYGVFAFFIFLHFHYILAALFATVLGIIFNFNTIGRIVFKKRENKLILKFICVYIVTYLLNILGLKIFNNFGISNYISGAILILPIAVIAYVLNRKFVFNEVIKKIPSKGDAFERQSLTNTLFLIIVSTALAFTYHLARFGLAYNSILDMAKVLCLAYFILLLPEVIWVIAKSKKWPVSWFNNKGIYYLLALMMVFVGGLIAPYLNLMIPFLVLAILFFFFFVYRLVAQRIIRLNIVIIALIFFIFVVGAVWGMNYQSPLYFEKIITGAAAPDTLFHTSIANMIATYGIPSHGLDGPVFVPYHFGSHYLFAKISGLVKIDILDFYNLAYPVIFIPMLFASILSFILSLRAKLGKNPQFSNWFWVVLFVAFTGVLPLYFSWSTALEDYTILISESYLISVSLLFFFLTILSSFYSKTFTKRNKNNLFFLLLFTPFMIGLIGFAKVSIIALLMGVFVFVYLRLKLYRYYQYSISLVLCAAVFLLVYRLTNFAYGSDLAPFSYLRTYVISPWQFYFIIVFYFWTGLYFVLRLRALKVKTLKDLSVALRERKIVDLEMILVLSVIGFIPGALFEIAGGSAGYFMGLQRWVSVALILTIFVGPSKASFDKFDWKSTKINTVIFAIICVPFAVAILLNLRQLVLDQFIKDNVNIRIGFMKQDNMDFQGFKIDFLNDYKKTGNLIEAIDQTVSSAQLALDRNNTYGVFREIRSLDKLPQSQRKNTLLFIPQSNHLYWDQLLFRAEPILAPALSGLSSIEGIAPHVPEVITESRMKYLVSVLYPDESQAKIIKSSYSNNAAPGAFSPNGPSYILRSDLIKSEKIGLYDLLTDPDYNSFGRQAFSMYQFPTEDEYLKSTTDPALCQKARSKGFDQIIILDQRGQSIEQRKLNCRR